MYRDPTKFRERFKAWKNGESVYEKGRPLQHYEDGKDGEITYEGGALPEVVVTAPRKYFVGYNNSGNPTYTDNYYQSQAYLNTKLPIGNVEKRRRDWRAQNVGSNGLAYPGLRGDAANIAKAAQLGIGAPLLAAASPVGILAGDVLTDLYAHPIANIAGAVTGELGRKADEEFGLTKSVTGGGIQTGILGSLLTYPIGRSFIERGFTPVYNQMKSRAMRPINLALPAEEGGVIREDLVSSRRSKPLQPTTYTISDYPGYQLKSLMRGNSLEKQLSKTGMISVNSIKALAAKGSNVEKAVIDAVLGSEQFAGQKSIDYNSFRKAVQNELISYNRIPTNRYESYGIDRLGYSLKAIYENAENESRRLYQELTARAHDFRLNHEIPHSTRANRNDPATREAIRAFNESEAGREWQQIQNDLQDFYNHHPRFSNAPGQGNWNRIKGYEGETANVAAFTFESPRIPIGNAKHYNPTTLGHSRTYTTTEEPDILHVMESQSDWAQNKPTEVLKTHDVKNLSELEEEIAFQKANAGKGYVGVSWKDRLKQLEAARYYLDPETSHLADNFERRQLQENLKYAAEHGQTRMRYPTPETAAKIEGYRKYKTLGIKENIKYDKLEISPNGRTNIQNDAIGEPYYVEPGTGLSYKDLMKRNGELYTKLGGKSKAEMDEWYNSLPMIEDYNPSHKTILKKYADFPKQHRKLYKNADVRTVTDTKGNTWFEVDVPKDYLKQEWQYKDGKDGEIETRPKSRWTRAMYNLWDPSGAYPNSLVEAFGMAVPTAVKAIFNPDKKEWTPETGISEEGARVADAAWRKRLGYSYDEKYLPVWNGDTISLPKSIEREIPVDTNFLKKRIENTKRLRKMYDKYDRDPFIQEAQRVDEHALEALRKTYKTGKPVGINEQAFNSRQWVKNGTVVPTMSPLNVFQNYNIRYDRKTNKMYYSDSYDFNQYEFGMPGKPFRFRGAIDLDSLKIK